MNKGGNSDMFPAFKEQIWKKANPPSSTIHLHLSVSLSAGVFERSMEETVRTLLQNQDSLEGPKVDPLDLMKAYKVQEVLQVLWFFFSSIFFPSEWNKMN